MCVHAGFAPLLHFGGQLCWRRLLPHPVVQERTARWFATHGSRLPTNAVNVIDPSVSEEEARAAVARLRSRLSMQASPSSSRALVGLDCEWGRVRKGQKLRGVDLIQIAPSLKLEESSVFRCTQGVPEPLKEFLQDPEVLKVVVGATDATLLYRSGILLSGGVDLQRVLRLLGIHEDHGTSLAAMYLGFCGKELSKGEQNSNWRSRNLSEGQLLYAAKDSVAALEVVQALAARYMPGGSAAEFAGLFIDSFTVVRGDELARASLHDACKLALSHAELAASLRRVLQAADDARPRSSRTNVKGQFYAVARGRKPGVYQSWEDCKRQVEGFTGARFKKFVTRLEAENFVKAW